MRQVRLREGGYYLDRLGNVHGPMYRTKYKVYCWSDGIDDYAKNGVNYVHYKDADPLAGDLNLVRECDPPPLTIIEEVQAELDRATDKFPTWPTDPLHALAVLGEEFGELTKAVLQHTYEPHKATLRDVKAEAIQTAAMALRFLESLEKYEYEQCQQHEQKED